MGVGNSLYWWGSLGYGCDTWVDGRYIDAYEGYVPGETFEDHPESDIILSEVALPIISYDLKYNYSTDSYDYSNIEITETNTTVRYTYDKIEKTWKADSNSIAITNSSYSTIVDMTEKGLIDEKYLDALQLTYDEVMALDVDRNTNINPTHYYLYNGTATPGTEIFMGDVNNDGTFNVADVVLLQKWLLAVPDVKLANWKAADLCEDGKLDVFDLCLMKRLLLNS